jgi:hypothetical protein
MMMLEGEVVDEEAGVRMGGERDTRGVIMDQLERWKRGLYAYDGVVVTWVLYLNPCPLLLDY